MTDVLIYTEGSVKLGLGNIYRSISLAREINKAESCLDIYFISSSGKEECEIIRNSDFITYQVNRFDLESKVIEINPKVLIIDFLGIPYDFLSCIKNKIKPKIVLIGNNSTANQLADLVVNAIVGTDFSNNEYIDEHQTKYLSGPKYLVLRDEFEEIRNSYKKSSCIDNITLLFGGTDQSNFSIKIAKDLINSSYQNNITIITGKTYPFYNELVAFSKSYKDRIILLHNIKNVSAVLIKSDFLISSPGTAMFEGFCYGIPTIGIYQNQSQKDVFGSFFMTYSYDNSHGIFATISKVFNNPKEYRDGLKYYAFGKGRKEIINNIINLTE